MVRARSVNSSRVRPSTNTMGANTHTVVRVEAVTAPSTWPAPDTAAAILELVDGQRDAAAIIAILNERFPEAGGVDDDVVEFLQIAYQQKWIIFREPE